MIQGKMVKPKSATMAEVARRARVSTATVSHVIHGTKSVHDNTRRRVLTAIEALDYHLNSAARYLATGHADIWGLLVSDIRNPFFPDIAAAFQREALQQDRDAVIMNTDWNAARTLECVKRLLQMRVPAIALMTSLVDESVKELLVDSKVCSVYLDLGKVGSYTSNIAVDYEQGVREVIAYLASLGHQRIGFIGGSAELQSVRRRQAAFLELTAASSSIEIMTMDSDFTLRGGYVACSKLLSRFSPTAIVAVNDVIAVGALHCASDRAVKVPDELSIVGFDDIPLAEFAQPALTTVNIPRDTIGHLAIQALQEMLLDPARRGKRYSITPTLVVRESSGKPNQSAKRASI